MAYKQFFELVYICCGRLCKNLVSAVVFIQSGVSTTLVFYGNSQSLRIKPRPSMKKSKVDIVFRNASANAESDIASAVQVLKTTRKN